MTRISEKALRPRQYVFNKLTSERIAALTPGVRKLREYERRQALSARAARRAVERHVAARHAENIMAGVTTPVPETDQIGELEKELEELRQRKRQLFEQLRKSLDDETNDDNNNCKQEDGTNNKTTKDNETKKSSSSNISLQPPKVSNKTILIPTATTNAKSNDNNRRNSNKNENTISSSRPAASTSLPLPSNINNSKFTGI